MDALEPINKGVVDNDLCAILQGIITGVGDLWTVSDLQETGVCPRSRGSARNNPRRIPRPISSGTQGSNPSSSSGESVSPANSGVIGEKAAPFAAVCAGLGT